ncbi:RraA family protein [Phytoactinopolyspora halotolerans]|uniref:Putative 4-hydroxy-4-methyl-2-oxoglutarate aldolase n=1 Tax=Phytoactinopolyspora halotolerans TaxID=1981512 RepID=A0A6L9S000_9ACTN|nr:RraA family protein [Phytoactinopolyspora halotolerans]NED98565.1 RraA family protein [Phytoactinopolyspora halotolerans]
MTTKELVALFEGLRVADVRDGMDWVGLHHKGTVSPDIAPLFQGAYAVGVAHTVRMKPSEKSVPSMPPEDYTDWAYNYWYRELYSSRPLTDNLQAGEMVVIESAGLDVGEVGSNNSLEWYAAGATGVVTSGGVRDRDECVHQRVPTFCRLRVQKMVQGRVEFDTTQVPVNIGGVLIRPGDVVVADGDGVIAVPVEHAETVARYARQELENDKAGRRKLYEKLGWPLDDTVR